MGPMGVADGAAGVTSGATEGGNGEIYLVSS